MLLPLSLTPFMPLQDVRDTEVLLRMCLSQDTLLLYLCLIEFLLPLLSLDALLDRPPSLDMLLLALLHLDTPLSVSLALDALVLLLSMLRNVSARILARPRLIFSDTPLASK